jgi:hypothetical protein
VRRGSGRKKTRIPAHGFRKSSVEGDSGQTAGDYYLKLNAIVRLLPADRFFSRLRQIKMKEHPSWGKVWIFLSRTRRLLPEGDGGKPILIPDTPALHRHLCTIKSKAQLYGKTRKMKNMNHSIFTFLLVAVLLTAGCTSDSKNAVVAAPQTPSQIPLSTSISPTTVSNQTINNPAPTTVDSLLITTTPSSNVTSGDTTKPQGISTLIAPAIQPTNAAPQASDPRIVDYHVEKTDKVPDCVMDQVFPEISKDPGYGLARPVPKLIGVSWEKYQSSIGNYFTDEIHREPISMAFSNCYGIKVSDITATWSFITANGTIMPGNAKVSDYEIILSVTSKGKIVSQVVETKTLTLDQPVRISTVIPIKYDEMDSVDNVDLNFKRLTNN